MEKGDGCWREVQEKMIIGLPRRLSGKGSVVFIRIADFLRCTAETSTTLQSKCGGGGGLVSKSYLTLATP